MSEWRVVAVVVTDVVLGRLAMNWFLFDGGLVPLWLVLVESLFPDWLGRDWPLADLYVWNDDTREHELTDRLTLENLDLGAVEIVDTDDELVCN